MEFVGGLDRGIVVPVFGRSVGRPGAGGRFLMSQGRREWALENSGRNSGRNSGLGCWPLALSSFFWGAEPKPRKTWGNCPLLSDCRNLKRIR